MTLVTLGTPVCLYLTPTRCPPSQAAVSCAASQGVELVPLRVTERHPPWGAPVTTASSRTTHTGQSQEGRGSWQSASVPAEIGAGWGWGSSDPLLHMEPVWKTTVKGTYREWQGPLGLQCRTPPAGRALRARLVGQARGRPSALLDGCGIQGPWHQPGPGSRPPGRWSPPRRGHL